MAIHKPSWPYEDTFDVKNVSIESTLGIDGITKFNGPVEFVGTPGDAGQLAMSYGVGQSPQWVSFQVKEKASAATTANVSGTYSDGTFTLTSPGLWYVDGYLTQLDDRILFKDQTNKAQNGIYIITVEGDVATQSTLMRDNDADTIDKLSVASLAVEQGTVNGGTSWVASSKTTDVLGVSSISFNQMLDSGSISSITRKPTRPTPTSTIVQSSLANRVMWRYYPSTLNATTATTEGFVAATQYGTAAAGTWATTNQFTRARRIALPSSATAGTAAGYRFPTASFTLGTGTTGGFYYSCKFGISSASEATFVSAGRTFVGLSSTATALTNAEPSTFINCIGVGQGAADTSWKIFWGGSAAQTPVDLGSTNFPYVTGSRDTIYELTLYSPSSTGNIVYYTFSNLSTGDTTSGSVSGISGTALPASTTPVTPQTWRTNNATAAAVDMSLIYLYMETES